MEYFRVQESVPLVHQPKADAYAQKMIGNIMLSSEQLVRQDRALAEGLAEFCQQTASLKNVAKEELLKIGADYRQLFEQNPVSNNKFGANYAVGLGVYAIARLLQPSFMVESGVYKGCTSFLLKNGAPEAEIHAYDLNLRELAYQTPGVNFHDHDWMLTPQLGSAAAKKFAFFDDHCPQAARILEAHRRGFRQLLLDDSYPMHGIHGDGYPPVPTVHMIMDRGMQLGERAAWVHQGRFFEYEHTKEMAILCSRARDVIAGVYELPSFWRILGWQPSSPLVFVELKNLL